MQGVPCRVLLWVVALLIAAPTDTAAATKSTASASAVTVGTVIGLRGKRVLVPVQFNGDGDTSELSADISFTGGAIKFNVNAPQAGYGGATCQRISDNLLHLQVGPTGSPLSNDIRYCDMAIDVDPTASGGSVVLAVSATCTDSIGSPSSCQTTNGAVQITDVQTSLLDGVNVVIAGYEGTAQESRQLRISNLGTGSLGLNCAFIPSDPSLSLVFASSVAAGSYTDVVATCQLPALHAPDVVSALHCLTTDPIRSVLVYNVDCTTVAVGDSLPGDQLLDGQLKAGDQLGSAVTQSSLSNGNVGVVALGAPFGGGDNSGRVILYEGDTQVSRSGPKGLVNEIDGARRRVATLGPPPRPEGKAATTSPIDKFGSAVVMTPDGLRIIIGAPGDGNGGYLGVVYVYDRPNTPGGWADLDTSNPATPVTRINPPTTAVGVGPSEFGDGLALTPDGDLVVAAPGSTVSGTSKAGAVFRYPKSGTSYTAEPDFTVTSPFRVTDGRFGDAIAMDDVALVVGAPQEGANNSQAGAAYLIDYIASTFQGPQPILDALLQQAGNKFGTSVAISGGVAVVGAPGADTSAGSNSGAAGAYTIDQSPPVPGPLTTLIPQAGDDQGAGSAVATNGEIIAVGAPGLLTGIGPTYPGKVFAFQLRPTPTQAVALKQTLRGAGGRAGDRFGREVSINRREIVVGAPLRSLVVNGAPPVPQVGQGDPFIIDGVFRSGFE